MQLSLVLEYNARHRMSKGAVRTLQFRMLSHVKRKFVFRYKTHIADEAQIMRINMELYYFLRTVNKMTVLTLERACAALTNMLGEYRCRGVCE